MFPKRVRISNPALINEVRKQPCVLTGEYGTPQDPIVVHHLLTIKSGNGHDLEWNLLPIRFRLHTPVIHQLGLTRTIEIFPPLKAWLLKHNWEFCEVKKKWTHGD